jgi:hypothetical protein
VREYNLKYTQDIYSQLVQIDEYNSKEEQLNATVINWGVNKNIVSSAMTINSDYYSDQAAFKDRHYISEDINGDGLSDLVSVFPYKIYTGPSSWSNVNILKVYQSVPSTTGIPTFIDGYTSEFSPSIDLDRIKYINSSITFGNFTGDDTKDVILPVYSGSYVSFNLLNHGKAIYVPTNSSSAFPVYAIQDLNNDKMDEIIYLEDTKKGHIFPGKIVYTDPCGINTPVDFYLYINKKH